MAKRRPSTARASSEHKKHGPKRHQFREYGKCGRVMMARTGVLNKYADYECFCQALVAHGISHEFAARWDDYKSLPMAKKKAYWSTLNRK